MKRTLLGVSAIVFSCFLMAAAKEPAREVKGTRLVSASDPAITIQMPRSAVYLGAERWDLYDVADCELHLFVEAYPDKTVKAMYWIQFEAYLPTNEHSYDYSKDEPVTFGGRPFWKSSSFGPTNNTPRAGGDGERTRQMLARAGYKLPAERMNVRLVHLPDESRRKELMIIYAEDLAPSGYTAAQLLDGKEPRPEWNAVERGLVERAMKRIALSPGSSR
jgi:hypothetical protein